MKAKTDKNGYAKFTLAVKPKAYTVIVTYNKVSQKYKVAVKNVIKAKNLKVKKSAKKLVLSATLKKGKTAIKSKIVKFKVNGKTYKGKTNKKGIAQVTIKKNVINKLKKGKTYAFKVTSVKDTIKSTVKVR